MERVEGPTGPKWVSQLGLLAQLARGAFSLFLFFCLVFLFCIFFSFIYLLFCFKSF